MKILFDDQVFISQRYGGISRYICCLAQALATRNGLEPFILAPFHFNQLLASLDIPGRRRVLSSKYMRHVRMIRALNSLLSNHEIRKIKPEIVHETYYSSVPTFAKGARTILTVYDFVHERYPEFFSDSSATSLPKLAAIRRADHVICISESTRTDLLNFCDVPESKISVVHLGLDNFFVDAPISRRLVHDRPFLLYVGARGGYKNFEGLVRALSTIKPVHTDVDLICFGGGKLLPNEQLMIVESGLPLDKVHQFDGGDEMLAYCYQQAEALVYPSLYEGFGIPPLEAMALNCPVICSDTSSLPEVVGSAAETFDPRQQESIRCAIDRVLASSSRRCELIQLGKQRHKIFTWEKCAEETEKVYRSLL